MRMLLGLSVVLCLAGGACSDDETADTPAADPCMEGCADALLANCDNGPPSQTQCEADCNAQRTGACGTEYEALLACNSAGDLTCDPGSGIPIVVGCETEQVTFIACLTAP